MSHKVLRHTTPTEAIRINLIVLAPDCDGMMRYE